MAIYGIGTDIVLQERISKLYHRYGTALAKRLLHPDEWQDWQHSKRPENFLAKRFAAKEAFSKAVGTGIREPVSLTHIGVRRNALGKPEFFVSKDLQNWLNQQGIHCVHLSLSDDDGRVLAFAVAEMKPIQA